MQQALKNTNDTLITPRLPLYCVESPAQAAGDSSLKPNDYRLFKLPIYVLLRTAIAKCSIILFFTCN